MAPLWIGARGGAVVIRCECGREIDVKVEQVDAQKPNRDTRLT